MMSDTDVEAAIAALEARGYAVERSTDPAGPAAVATPTPGARPLFDHLPADERPVAVERASADPTTLLHRVAEADGEGRRCLFVADPATAGTVRTALGNGGLRVVDPDGRSFYDVPDRVPCTDGSYGAVRTEGDLRWLEEAFAGERRLLLLDDGRVVAAFDGVDALSCPGPAPAAFPYTYRRGRDKRLHVTDRRGREVGVFNTVRAMKNEAYRPVAEPLVPEHVFRSSTRLSDAWAAMVVDDGRVVEVATASDSPHG
jgi:hypothetical protein